MHVMEHAITKPTDESAFEDMCARIYSEVLNDPFPKINGRRGQAQGGIDIFVTAAGARIGIQCKRYLDGALKFKDVQTEVRRADDAKAPITRLVVATTAVSDAKLLRQVQDLSDQRVAAGQFPVEIEFWEDICRHIKGSGKLQRDYAPNAPGGIFHRVEESNLAIRLDVAEIKAQLTVAPSLPEGRSDSLNKFISAQLDGINELLKTCRFRDALEAVNRLGGDMSPFDQHQKARWHLQRGICTWHLNNAEAASADFIRAVELYPDDEKVAAAGVRALLLQGDVLGAIEAGVEAFRKFPASAYVWMAYANARVANGEHLTLTDAPPGMESNTDILQLLAWSHRQAGDLPGAIHLIGKALSQPDAGFFVKSIALAFALESVTADRISCAFDLLPSGCVADLNRAIDALHPRKTQVWEVQSAAALSDTLANLGCALLLVGRSEEALQLVSEAQSADMLTPEIMRVALEAYRRLDRVEDVLAHGRSWLSSLQEPSLVLVAEVAAEVGDVNLVSSLSKAAEGLKVEEPETPNILKAMRWRARWRASDERDQLVSEITGCDLPHSTSVPLICGGARILHLAGEEHARDAAVAHVVDLLSATADEPSTLLVADLLYSVGRFGQAAKYYERFATRGMSSVLHARLLRCYVDGKARLKARDLLKSLPGDWASNDELRELALEVGRQAGDWEFLDPLAIVQCERYPNGAGGWLLRLVLSLKTRKMHKFHQTLEIVPGVLDGQLQQIAQIAALELKYDRKAQGMRRLYRLFRTNLDSVEAASGYFTGIVSASGELPFMESSVESIAAGTTVELEDEAGATILVSIDPLDVEGASSRDGFCSPTDAHAAALIGATIGDLVELPSALSVPRALRVRSISSVYRHLMRVAQERFQNTLSGKGHVASIPIRTTSEGTDLSLLNKMLKQQKEHSVKSFDAYANGPLTLGILGSLLGRSAIDLLLGWPTDESAMFVCAGTSDEWREWEHAFQRGATPYVVDAVTIAELVLMGCERALAAPSTVFCSTATLEALEARLEKARSDKPHGQLYGDGDAMRYIEVTEEDIARRLAVFQSMVDAVQTYCEVVPAYGPHSPSPELQQAGDVLSSEEYSAVLLAIEKGAALLTVDGRLARLFTAMGGISSLAPQALARFAAASGAIDPRTYSGGVAHQFLANRTFISVAAHDLVLMTFQGGNVLRVAIQRFKDCLSSPSTDLPSTLKVAFEFLRLRAVFPTQVKAFFELFEHLVEAILRHPKCDTRQLERTCILFSEDMSRMAAASASPYPQSEAGRQLKVRVIRDGLANAFLSAKEMASGPAGRRPVRLKTLMCMSPPWLGFDGDVTDVSVPELADAAIGIDEGAPSGTTAASTGYLIDADHLQAQAEANLGAAPPQRSLNGTQPGA